MMQYTEYTEEMIKSIFDLYGNYRFNSTEVATIGNQKLLVAVASKIERFFDEYKIAEIVEGNILLEINIENYISDEEKRKEISSFIEDLKNNNKIEKNVEFIEECDIIINILNNLERLKIHQKNLLKDDNEESNQNEIFI